MIKAVLLDLDNTLIHNPEQAFARALMDAVETFFHQQYHITGVAQALSAGVKAQQHMRPPRQTNEALMQAIIARQVPLSAAQIAEAFTAFYVEVYPRLRDCVQPIAIAPELVNHLIAQGYAVVIATNPLYPWKPYSSGCAGEGCPMTLALTPSSRIWVTCTLLNRTPPTTPKSWLAWVWNLMRRCTSVTA
ncbi:HAD family hydrolase [bacterium]|nr:HAD family hydrolase [bacterium]